MSGGSRTRLERVRASSGIASLASAAVRIAHEVYEAARAATGTGLGIPHERPDSWLNSKPFEM